MSLHVGARIGLYATLAFAAGGLAYVGLARVDDQALKDFNTPIPIELPAEFDPLLAQVDLIRPLHEKKKPIQPGDWLERNPEGGQLFSYYVKFRGSLPLRDEFTTLYVQPLGEFGTTQERILRDASEFLGLYFGLPVQTLDAQPIGEIPDAALLIRENGERRVDTHWLMDTHLTPRRPADAVAMIGLVTCDLFNDNHGWLFGEASMAERVGVWSLHRNGDPRGGTVAYRACLRRTLKTAVHETGHILGMPHCAAWECAMNGSRSREENDSQPLEMCPECQPKIWWTCRADPVQRSRSLLDFAERAGLTTEAAFWRREWEALSAAEKSSTD